MDWTYIFNINFQTQVDKECQILLLINVWDLYTDHILNSDIFVPSRKFTILISEDQKPSLFMTNIWSYTLYIYIIQWKVGTSIFYF